MKSSEEVERSEAEAISSSAEPLEDERLKRDRWRSIYIIYFTTFQMSLGFSIVLTGVWPYLDKLSPGASKSSLGLAVGAHPVGQLALSALAGLWADRSAPRTPLVATLALSCVANALYAMLHLTRPHALPAMLLARFLVGAGSANVAVARSYLSSATLLSERTRGVAGVSLAQVLGFVVGPALQAAAAPLGPGPAYPPLGEEMPIFRLDMYTAAGWISATLCLINMLLFLPGCFKESHIATKEAMRSHGITTEEEALRELKPDVVSSWTLVVAFFVLVFNFVLLETLATSLTMDQFGWDKQQALRNMGILMSVGAVVACVTFALITPLTKCFEERALMLWGGFLLTGIASLVCIPWGPEAPPKARNDSNGEVVGGCPSDSQPWCESTRAVQLPQFLLGYTFISVGYPIGVTLIQTIFSKVLGPRPQGVWMGVLTGAGCVSRALGPLYVSLVYARFGPDAVFGSTGAFTLVTLAVLRCLYSRLRPPPPTLHPPLQEMKPLNANAHSSQPTDDS